MSESMIEANRTPIAVVGVSALFPGSLDSAGFWRDILASRDLIQDVPPSHWLIEDYYDADPKAPDKTYARRGAFLGDIDFDALSWGVPPSIMPATDTSQLLGLIVAQRVLQDALGAQFETASRERTSVILGVTSAQELLASMVGRLQRPVWVKALREAGIPEDEVQAICDNISDHYTPWQESTFPGLLGNVVAGRIANRLDLGGTNCVTDAACASTFSALHMAIGELQLGSSDLVIAGGVDTLNDIFMFMCFSKTPALSATGDCRPFSAKGDGTMLGEGLGMVALKRLADAERDGDRIYAVIKGVGTSSDGRSKSVYAPVAAGQARALKRAYKNAGHSPATVELVEAHGTGTIAGDAAEFNGLRLAFEDDGDRQQWCALGSVKSQIGHTKAAAGAAGLFKAVMALHHKTLPPTLKVEAPNPKLDLSNSPFYLSLHKRPWVRGSEHPRRASVSSFGFGGSNYHLALEEYTQERTARRLDSFDHKLVVLGAQSASALVKDTREAAKSAADKGMLAWLSRSSQAAYDGTAKARLALLAKDGEDLQAKLEASAARIESDPTASFVLPDGTAYGVGDREGEVAFLFSGQGSQYVGMGADVAMAWDAAICAWDEAADQTFDPALPLAEVVFPRPGFEADADAKNHARLTATEWAQPAIGTASLALLGILDQIGVKPTMVGGHSFGEVTALHAAGVLSREDFLKIARKRGELMAEAAALPGAMTVVSKPIEEVRALVERLGEGVTVANHNHPTQVVLSGPTDAIEALEDKLKAEGVRSKRLSVATAFHSPVVAGSCKPFGAFLETVNFSAPELPVFANCKAAPYEEAAGAIRETLSGAIAQPVRFVEMIKSMYAAGARTFVEVGPQAVLTGLTGRILGKQSHAAIALDRKGKSGVDMLFMALAKLAAAGVPMDLGALWSEYREVVDPATVKRPKLAVPINGSNYGKPYPPKNGAAGLPKPNPKRTVTNAPSVPALPKVDASLAHAGGQPLPTSSAPLALASAPVHTPRPFAEPSAMPNPTHPYPANPSPATPEPAAFSAAGPSPVSLPASAHAGWIAAFQETQRQTAEAHASFQQAMASSHAAFLQTAESSFQGLAAMVSGQPVIAAQPGLAPNLAPVFAPAQPQFAAAPVSPVFAPPIASAAPIAVPSPRPAPMPVTPAMAPVVASPAAAPAPTPVAQAPVVALPAAPALDLNALMLEVVADKTGYPAEMLNAGMDLEGDLGIDSIKRVEILAAVQKQAPGMPDVDAGHMGTLRTLAEIVEYMQSLMPASAAHGSAAATGNIGPAIDLHALMLEVVAEKTGYPAEMLSAEMDLEGDLGIDSIKRVEILAAVQKQAPGMPDVDAGHMGTLRTLAEIIGYMQGLMPSAGASGASSAAALTTPAAAAPAPTIDLNALMLEVVAEKTGYPADMLSPEMELEGDLGIDSIKRVEILAAVQKRAPGMPDVDAGHMGTLQTLAQIVDYMQSLLAEAVGVVPSETTDVVPSETTGVASPASAAPTQAPANAVTTASPQAPALGRFDLRVVSAPATGLAQPGLLGGHPVYVTADGTDLNHRLAVLLQERGVAAHAVDAVPAGAHAAIFLGGLRSLGSEADAIAINREAFAAARTLAPTLTTEAGLFVTVQDTGGSFCLSGASRQRALVSGLPALTKTALQEWPKASLKSIDIEVSGRDTEAIARCLRDELLLGGGEIEVGLNADGSRHTLQSVEVAVQRGAARIGAGDVVVVSGGARGVTAACVIEWAKETRARFVLLGRTPLSEEPTCCAGVDSDADLKRALLDQARAAGQLPTPAELGAKVRRILGGREIRSTLAAINAAGAEARYEAVSVTDAAKLSTTLDVIRKEWGPITGLVHGAGVLADKVIAEKTDEQFDRVFDTKIVGIQCLLAATKGDALKVLCMFSSVSARCGNNGQSDYAMANEILGKLAHTEARARGESCLVKSLAWGPWEGGMVTPQLKARFAELGVPMIPLQVGARMFTDELCSAQTAEIELVLGGEPKAEALLFEGTAERWFEMQVRVDRTSHEYLAGHSIAEAPVVPVVLALEWFARHARSLRPGLQLTAIRNVQVIKGIELAGFDTAGDLFSVRSLAQPSHAGAAFAMELRGQGGTLHYRASAELSSEAPTSTEAVPQPALADWPHPLIYGDVLFHEGPFQVIESMDGVSDDAIGATLRGILEAGWREESWCLDVAALDGGLQLAILLGRHTLDAGSLPTSVEEFRSYVDGPVTGPVRCTVLKREGTRNSLVTDMVFSGSGGQRLFELRGVSNHVLRSPSRLSGANA